MKVINLTTYSRWRAKLETPIQVNLTVNQKPLTMELEQCIHQLISEQTYKATWPEGGPSLRQSSMKLHMYTGEQVVVVGSVTITVCYNTQVVELPLLIVKGKVPVCLAEIGYIKYSLIGMP